MGKKINLSDMIEHLFESAERLLDPEVCCDRESVKNEIQKAQAISQISDSVVKIKEVEINQINAQVHAMEVANRAGMIYKPEGLNMQVIEHKSEPTAEEKKVYEW